MVQIQAGQTLRVRYSFGYRAAERTSVPLWASLYRRTAGILNRAEQAQTKTAVALDPSLDWRTYQGQVDVAVGRVDAGLYGLMVELPGFENAEAHLDDVIDVAATPGLADWMGPLMMIAMLGMVARMMPRTEGNG